MKCIAPVIVGALVLLLASPAATASPPAVPPAPAETVQQPAPPAATSGRLAIRAVQGTPGADPIGQTAIEVQLYHNGSIQSTIEDELDEHGVVVLENIPIEHGVQPIVIVHYAGVRYQKAGSLLDSAHPEQSIEVICYELTQETPPWKITMRHIALEQVENGLRVLNILSIENPDDRTWRGVNDPAFAAQDKLVTTRFDIPQSATGVQLGRGFHDWCCTSRTEGQLVNHLPLMPSGAEMTYSYVVPTTNGSVDIDFIAPAATDHLMVLVPTDLNLESFTGLEYGGEQVMNQTTVRFLNVSNMTPDQRAAVTIGGLSGAGSTLASTEGGNRTKIIAGVGGGLILLVAVGVILVRPKRKEETTPAH